MGLGGTVSYRQFRDTRFFAPLDGVRAIAVIMVITWHLPETSIYSRLNGWEGVNIFFGLSGFLITTLLIRERDAGHLSLRGFYIRRAHRILPVYALALGLYVLLTAGGAIPTWQRLWDHIGYFATLNVDLVRHDPMPFSQAWSLGVEEKFYLAWPLLLVTAVFAVRRAWRVWIAALPLLVALAADEGLHSTYADLYIAISAGCLLAFALDDERFYRPIRRLLAIPLVAVAVIVLVQLVLPHGKVYALVSVAALGCVLVGATNPAGRLLATRPLQWVGRRSYSIYLIHGLAIQAARDLIGIDAHSVWRVTTRFVLVVALSCAAAHLIYMLVERPMIRRGHRLAAKPRRARGEPVIPAEAT